MGANTDVSYTAKNAIDENLHLNFYRDNFIR